MHQVSISIAWISNFFSVIFNQTATHTWCTQLLNCGKSSRRRLGVQLHCSSFHFYHRVWLPHLGQHLSVEREHGNAEDHFAIGVREHSDTRADEDVNERHLPTLFHWWSLCWRWRAMQKWVKGRLHCKGQYRVLSRLCCLHKILITLEQAMCEIYLLSI